MWIRDSYGPDFLAEVSYGTNTDFTLLEWVFGGTGRRVQLTAMSQFTGYEILDTCLLYTSERRCGPGPAVWFGCPDPGR